MKNINFEELAKSVGKAIGRQRQRAGLTQDQVAEGNPPIFRSIQK